ncbi:tonB-linked outer membrane, SusC/RagA family protein [Bacteroides fragilis str. S6L8]|uniref:TonB-linked outer membrane, SusC/RagA family protein n=3 Tax=Bacteroides fragilis TaxID=817 RepID=A0A015YXQ4_BACFG|nr:tonB-linked outer membrane, SusC/RagA family protein [Bacteroides fragilis str. DS-166]EXZ09017.1 tonB-linked outer membrane, SusC/RagA family protein [Bacteroides fragilis str. DS-71]EXZ18307.1 tonB-linked outer membrane, SusC/RagA family protein [Bacteroides fragilis str. J-143-4]EXZ27514.1 tonB-linked outer membrane, SusC/RagA family protein [Bacteroides fragilis str. S36L11]EXZ72234.1 tonB-linked outer membrane, SusC/RagA family protein [Bacteroides fragilis str. 3976T8]EYA03617.1 tonB-
MQQQNLKVSGVVTDEAGEPLIGVSVLVKGTTLGNITDLNGRFSLDVPEGSILEISYIGYKTQSIKAQREPMNIVLKEDAQKLDEVVVVGFGTQKKVNLTGSVSAVTGDDISKRPVANAAILLQGQIPGLRVNQGLGQPGGEGTSFRIRGQGTFSSAGSDPLILINGVPGSMTNLDPSVIESVSVLKDAASAAIYGARAANGVILVTTKQGAVGDKVHISYHGNVGLHTPTKLYDRVTNSVEYMELANLAWKNSGTGKQYTQDQINLYRNNVGDPQYPNFDWQDYMFRTAVVQTHNLSMAGSTEKTTYNVALNFVDQPGTMRGFKYRKYNATIDLTARITNFIKVGTYANLMYGETEQPRQGQNDAFLSTLSQAPTYMPWLPDDGTGIRRWTSSAYSFESHNKNMPAIIGDNAMKRDNNFDINAQLWLEINLAKGLTWYTKGAARLQSNKSKDWRGSTTYTYDYHTGERSSELDKGGLGLSVGDGRRFYTNLYSYLKYDLSLVDNAHNFSLMVGYNQESEKYETLNAYRKDFAFDLPVLNAGGTADWSNSGGEEEWAIQSLFGRFNYDFKERYLFEANMRYDGTSRISDENRWGVFPSFSVAWRATEEEFIKNLNLNWLNNFKLRGSWGQLGNQNIGLYPYQAMISGVDDYPFTKTSDGVIIGYQQTAYANRNIKWETTTITDIGFDLQVFDGLSVTFDWYKKTTDDILRSSQVSSLLGLSAPTVNNGSVENKGIEVALNYANMVKGGTFRGFRYNAGVYFDRSRNKLTEFGAEEIGSYSIKREGLPYDEYYMLECIGVFADQAEINASPKQFNDNTQPGDLKYKDISGPDGKPDGVIDNYDRRTFSGRFPGFEYGINASATWKGFDLSLIGQGVADKKYYTTDWGVQPFMQGSSPNKDYIKHMWTEENPYGAKHPKLYWQDMGGGKNTRPNSYYLKDASFFRLKNVTLGYTLPRVWTEKANISKVRIYFSGDNLLTLTPYKGLDPERNGDGRDAIYPQNRIYSFGLNVEF